MFNFQLKGEKPTHKAINYTRMIAIMNQTAKFPSVSTEAYMQDYAARCKNYAGVEIPVDSPKAFIQRLVELGEVLIIE